MHHHHNAEYKKHQSDGNKNLFHARNLSQAAAPM
jgi:hypothetical protein